MKINAVAESLKIASERLGTLVSAQPFKIQLSVHAHSIVLAHAIGDWLLYIDRSDQTSVLSEVFKSFFKTKTENLSLADDVSQEFYKGLRENAGLSDQQIRQFFKRLVDTTEVADIYQMHLVRGVQDIGGLLDKAVIDTSKTFTELVTTTDDIDGSASLNDDQKMQFVKQRTDAVQFTDTGSLRSQGYCDFSYFAEDYVGASRTF